MSLSPLLPSVLAQLPAKAETMSLSKACEPNVFGEAHFQWQQNLRVVRHHLEKVSDLRECPRRVFVVVLTDAAERQFARFESMLRAVLRNTYGEEIERRVEIEPSAVISDAGDYDLYRKIYRSEIAKRYRRFLDPIPYRDVSIDVSPGNKLSSIAAAELTFNNDVEFTYIESGDRIHVFDARLAPAPEAS